MAVLLNRRLKTMGGFRGAFILCMLSVSVLAQTNRYIVFFKDKTGTPYQVSQPNAFLSQKALNRRTKIGISVTTDDLPVTPAYVTQVKATGLKTFFTSRWMNAVLVEATPSVISLVAALPMVSKTELVAPGNKLLGGRIKSLTSGHNTTATQESTQTQLQMLGLDKMQADGIYGEGVMISILDGGFPGVNITLPFQPIYSEGRLKMTQDFVTNSGNVYQFHDHGTKVFSVIAAKLQGSFTGGAYKASYLLFVTEDVLSEYRIEEYNWLFAAEKADSSGTDVIQSSLGYNLFDDATMNYKTTDLDGKTAVISRAAGMARDRGIIVVVSAGNQFGWPYITPPADADGILAVGAVNASGIKSSFSSIGPTADGRIKPDVAALGQNVSVVLTSGALGTEQGTSMAAPLVTSLAAGLLQIYPNTLPAEIIKAIKLSGSQSTRPDNQLGYGVPNYTAMKNYLEFGQLAADVTLFPNPGSSIIQVAFKEIPNGPVTITIYDLQGKQMASSAMTLDWLHNPVDVAISNLSVGTYLLRIETSTVFKTLRFVKL